MDKQAALQWPSSPVNQAVEIWWQCQPAPRPQRVAVALSGGADSTALLLALWQLAARESHLQPVALHVHHGLQEAADAFSVFCQQWCAELGVSYCVQHVQVELQAGDSVEARAREARYRALADMAHDCDVVLLAQHADDQVESVLLALSRGAGVAGLAGMASHFQRHQVEFARPLLGVRAEQIRDWLRQHEVAWVEDPSNTDFRYTRNRIRHGVLPVLQQALPSFTTGLTRSARLAAQADTLLQELADMDLQTAGVPPNIAALQRLSSERQANALRHWLKKYHQVIGSEAQIQTLQRLVQACTTRGHKIHLRVGQGFVHRTQNHLDWYYN